MNSEMNNVELAINNKVAREIDKAQRKLVDDVTTILKNQLEVQHLDREIYEKIQALVEDITYDKKAYWELYAKVRSEQIATKLVDSVLEN